MNERDISSEVFQSPKGRSRHTIHSRFWRQSRDKGRLHSSQEQEQAQAQDDHFHAKEKRKERLKEAKRKAMLDYSEKMGRRIQRRELAQLNNNRIRQELERRRNEAKRQDDKSKAPRTKRIRKRIIRRKIIRRIRRRPSDTTEEDSIIDVIEEEIVEHIPDEAEVHEIVDDDDDNEYEEEEVLEGIDEHEGSHYVEVEEGDLDQEFEYVEDVVDGGSIEEVFEDHEYLDSGDEEEFVDSQGNILFLPGNGVLESGDENETKPQVGDSDEENWDDPNEEGRLDEEEFFAKVRSEDEPLSEEDAFRLEQEELFRLAAQRQAEEEEDLRWEEEELMREEEARRLAEEEELKRLRALEEQRLEREKGPYESLNALLLAHPKNQLQKPKPKPKEEESVLDKPIGYREPSLLALVSKAKTELRPPPPPEHKEEYAPIVLDASSIGRLVRLNERTIETQGKREKESKTDSSYKRWENQHSRRGSGRKPITVNTRSDAQIMVNEAAALGKLRRRRSASRVTDLNSPQSADVDIDDLGDTKHDGAKVFRTEHLIDRHIQAFRRSTDWTPDYNLEEYETLDDVDLPTEVLPSFKPTQQKKTQQEIREELSQAVAEGYWARYYRLERPGAQLLVTPGCYCKYCYSSNEWQTFAYQKKWAEEKLPPTSELGEEPDPSAFGHLARLYLPEKSEHQDIEVVDLKPPAGTMKQDLELISADGTCSVDFSLSSAELDELDETDDDMTFDLQATLPTESQPRTDGTQNIIAEQVDAQAADTQNNPSVQGSAAVLPSESQTRADNTQNVVAELVDLQADDTRNIPVEQVGAVAQPAQNDSNDGSRESSTIAATTPSGETSPQTKNVVTGSTTIQESRSVGSNGIAIVPLPQPPKRSQSSTPSAKKSKKMTHSSHSTRSDSQKKRRFRPIKWMQKMMGRSSKSLANYDSDDTINYTPPPPERRKLSYSGAGKDQETDSKPKPEDNATSTIVDSEDSNPHEPNSELRVSAAAKDDKQQPEDTDVPSKDKLETDLATEAQAGTGDLTVENEEPAKEPSATSRVSTLKSRLSDLSILKAKMQVTSNTKLTTTTTEAPDEPQKTSPPWGVTLSSPPKAKTPVKHTTDSPSEASPSSVYGSSPNGLNKMSQSPSTYKKENTASPKSEANWGTTSKFRASLSVFERNATPTKSFSPKNGVKTSAMNGTVSEKSAPYTSPTRVDAFGKSPDFPSSQAAVEETNEKTYSA